MTYSTRIRASKNLSTIVFIFLAFYTSHSTLWAHELVKNPSTMYFEATSKYGLIGTDENNPVDNPQDNFFHIELDDFDEDGIYYLEYDLKGVSSAASVNFSINDQLTRGGQIIELDDDWINVKEPLRSDWLRPGQNIVFFSTREIGGYTYEIKNLRFSKETFSEDIIVFSEDALLCLNGLAYLRGIANSINETNLVSFSIEGRQIELENGSFEESLMVLDLQKEFLDIEVITSDEVKEFQLPLSKRSGQVYGYFVEDGANKSTVEFVKGKKGHIAIGSASLTLDQDLLNKTNLDISVTELHYVDLAPMKFDLTNVTAREVQGYRFLPHGHHFDSTGATMSIPYDPALIPEGYNESDVRTFYFDLNKKTWIPIALDHVDEDNNIVVSRVSHFSDYINGVISSPEAPESSGFAPNQFNDLPAALPTAGVNMISPPTANNQGDAILSYPIEVPAGRNGIQPALAVTYNSSGGNGWLGEGWDLDVPSIDVDTRWGVPRYDPNKESETYLLAGQQLITFAVNNSGQDQQYLAHKAHEYLDRKDNSNLNSVVQYYPRRQSTNGYHRIEKYGDDPSNYRWEVTDRNGIKYYYGGVNAVDNNAVLRTGTTITTGAIVSWKLVRVEDLYGNYMSYTYERHNQAIGTGQATIQGTNLYLRQISYTAHNDGKTPKYFVNFSSGSKSDATYSARSGAIIHNGKELQRIDVFYNTQLVRRYVFRYTLGGASFLKNTLQHIIVEDGFGAEFYRHSFDYWGIQNYDEDGVQWDMGQDGLAWNPGAVPSDLIGSGIKYSALSGGSSEGKGFSAYFGLGPNGSPSDGKKNTGGLQFSLSGSDSRGKTQLVDLNGDGLLDKVFNDNGAISYAPNISRASGNSNGTNEELNTNFDLIVSLPSAPEFSEFKSTSVSFGLQTHIDQFMGGASFQHKKDKTLSYFADVNADGLTDIVSNGIVYFNRIVNEIPTFERSSSDTPCPIDPTDMNFGNLFSVDEQELEEDARRNPLLDAVRTWKAPYSGNIDIASIVNYIGSSSDGAWISILYLDSDDETAQISQLLAPQFIDADNPNLLPSLSGIGVNEDDVILFRVQSGTDLYANGEDDQVDWNIEISYDVNSLPTQILEQDVFGKDISNYTLEADALPSSPTTLLAEKMDGSVYNLEGTIDVTGLCGTVQFEIYKNDVLEIASPPLSLNTSGASDQILVNESIVLDQGDLINLRLVSTSNFDWNGVSYDLNWNNEKVAIEFAYYDPIEVMSTSFSHVQGLNENVDYTIDGNLSFDPGFSLTDAFVLSIKVADGSGDHRLIYEESLDIASGSVSNPSITNVNLQQDESIYACIYTRNAAVLTNLVSNQIALSGGGDVINYDLSSWYYGQELIGNRIHEGNDYRGWGKFFYTPGYGGANMDIPNSIMREDLVIPDDPNGYNNPNAEISDLRYWRATLISLDGDLVWTMGDASSIITGSQMSSSRLGEDDVSADQLPVADNTIRLAAIKKNRTNGGSAAAGASTPPLPVGAIDAAWTTSIGSGSKSLLDYLDLNGDSYPDYVQHDGVLYSNPVGNFEDQFTSFTGSQVNRNAKQNFQGVTGAGNFGFGKQTFLVPTIKAVAIPWCNSVGLFIEFVKETGHNGSLSISAELNRNIDNENVSLIDINGDGLPDRLDRERQKVRLNLGYSFSDEFDMNFLLDSDLGEAVISRSRTDVVGGGGSLGFSMKNGSYGGGVGGSISKTILTHTFQDINADGLPDFIYYSKGTGLTKYLLNHNGAFIPYSDYSLIDGNVLSSTAYGASLGASVTFRFPVFAGVDIAINPSLSGSLGMTRTETQYADIDGDGFVDYLTTNPPDNIRTDDFDGNQFVQVHRAQIGKTNKLRTVTLPFGGEIALEYGLSAATYEHPGGKWVLSAVTIDDMVTVGENDVNDSRQEFLYEEGYYDRCERQFLGFGKITVDQFNSGDESSGIYRKTINEYYTDYYRVGIAKSTELWNHDKTEQYSRTEIGTFSQELSMDPNDNSYSFVGSELLEVDGAINAPSDVSSIFSAANETTVYWYEGGETAYLASQDETTYDDYGNTLVYKYTNSGQNLSAGERYRTTVTYAQDLDLNVMGIGQTTVVNNGPNETVPDAIVRQTSAVVETDYARLESVTVTGSPTATTDYQYDDTYGVLRGSTLPDDGDGNRISYVYDYDPEYLFMTRITESISSGQNPYTYITEMMDYDYRWGTFDKQIDINGNITAYQYDSRGRLMKMTGPKEYEEGNNDKYTVKYAYPNTIDDDIEDMYSTTTRFEPIDRGSISSWTFVDGLGREIQTIAEAVIETDPDAGSVEKVLVRSGIDEYDGLGRLSKNYYPTVAAYDSDGYNAFDLTVDAANPTVITYDILDRERSLVRPNGSAITTAYALAVDAHGDMRLHTEVTAPGGKKTDTYTRAGGVVTSSTDHLGDQQLITKNQYDGIEQLTKITNPVGQEYTMTYDIAGKVLHRTIPDGGFERYTYNEMGNVMTKSQSDLFECSYVYNGAQLLEVNYPASGTEQMNVRYTYGDQNATDNRIGKIVTLSDITGTQEFWYGNMGEVVKQRRMIAVPYRSEGAAFDTEYEYDTWNRLLNMTYPDGEVVNYEYNETGELQRVTGQKSGDQYVYLEEMRYDKFGSRVYMQYGNGTDTRYAYEYHSRWISSIQSTNGTGTQDVFQDLSYAYYPSGNIRTVENFKDGAIPTDRLSAKTRYYFEYDELYRLRHTEATYHQRKTLEDETVFDESNTFNLDMTYDQIGNIKTKTLDVVKNDLAHQEGMEKGYDLVYNYDSSLKGQLKSVDESSYTNNLTAASKNVSFEIIHDYKYDTNGNTKEIKKEVDADQATPLLRKIVWREENQMSALADGEFVNHYFYDASGERVLKMSQQYQKIYVNGEDAGSIREPYKWTMYVGPHMVVRSNGEYTKHIYINGERIVSKIGHEDDYNDGLKPEAMAKTDAMAGDLALRKSMMEAVIVDNYSSANLGLEYILEIDVAPYVPSDRDLVFADPYELNESEVNQYFYVKDHLGTSSYITDVSGNVIEHLEYIPFGETFVEERASQSDWKTPYRFTGKEQDCETGLYYYGARYYDAKIGRFLSVDPLADDAADWTPYHYTWNNPIYYTDPDGRWPFPNPTTIQFSYGMYRGAVNWGKNTANFLRRDMWKAKTWKNALKYVEEIAIGSSSTGSDFFATPMLDAQVDQLVENGSSGDPQVYGEMLSSGTLNVTTGLLLDKGVGTLGKIAKATPDPPSGAMSAPVTDEIYSRPSGATTRAQRESVQGQPCVNCGDVAPTMYADHKYELVKEHYETGTIDLGRMRSTDAVQPHCPSCSRSQGGHMSQYSKKMKAIINERTGGG